VRGTCLDMFKEVEGDENVDEVDVAKRKAQMGCNEKICETTHCSRQLVMFEKGIKHKTIRRCREEDPSDDEEPCQLVCNMAECKWELLPYPIIVDYGACASVMPINWCEHVPLRETPQSQAGGFFRAANGQTILNHGENVISMITKEGAKRDMRFKMFDVRKALEFVPQMCRTGHCVVFNTILGRSRALYTTYTVR